MEIKKIYLISCASKKQESPSIAKELYISPLFKYSLKYSSSFLKKQDKIYVLSAKYHLLKLNDKISPYNITLNNMKDKEVREWGAITLEKLKEETNLKEDEFIFLAGEKYRKYLIPYIKNYKVPLKGLSIGNQLKFLKEECEKL